VEGALARRFVHLEIIEKVIDDLLVVEADFREIAAADVDDLMHVAFDPGIGIVHRAILRIIGGRARSHFRSAQRGFVTMLAQGTSVRTDNLEPTVFAQGVP
jgi:ribosomal protein S13